jgi:hypothetical protein
VRSRRALALTALLLPLAACSSTGIRSAEIPEAPIAFVYLTPEEARRRAEKWADQRDSQLAELREQARREERLPEQTEMRASADALEDFLGRVLGRADDPAVESGGSGGRLALLDPRSGELKVLEAARRGSVPLAWSPDRTRLLFAQPVDRDVQLYEYDRERGTVRPVTHGPPAHPHGCYAAEGRIAVAAADARENPPRFRIELSRPGGVGPFEPLTEWGNEHSPSCAPDGSAVVWERSQEDGRSELRLRAPLDGETSTLSPGRQPRFSADGAWIVFSARQQGEWRVWRVRPDGSGRAPIGRGQRNESRPALSPDGRFVVYVAAEQVPRRHLYLRRFDGSGDRILFADGDGEYPVW